CPLRCLHSWQQRSFSRTARPMEPHGDRGPHVFATISGLLSGAFQLLTLLSGFISGNTATRRRHSQLFYRLSPKISL
ncbi:hypothetical protein ACC685_39060, partial [Rhizobium ruizarguesonis]